MHYHLIPYFMLNLLLAGFMVCLAVIGNLKEWALISFLTLGTLFMIMMLCD